MSGPAPGGAHYSKEKQGDGEWVGESLGVPGQVPDHVTASVVALYITHIENASHNNK